MMDTNTGIKSWAEEDRPYEKILANGARHLTDSELLAIFIKAGLKNKTSVDIAKELLLSVNNDLDELGKLSVKQLVNKKIKGLGEVKSINIVAALELGRRRRERGVTERKKIASSRDAFEILFDELEHKYTEEFWILLLDQANKVLQKLNISKGGIAGTIADPKVIFKLALEYHACGIILSHNHPSGNLLPSDADKKLTRKLWEAGNSLEIKVLDHIIIAADKYLSFADEGMMPS